MIPDLCPFIEILVYPYRGLCPKLLPEYSSHLIICWWFAIFPLPTQGVWCLSINISDSACVLYNTKGVWFLFKKDELQSVESKIVNTIYIT